MDSVEFTSEPAPEVLRFFRNKGLRPSFSWRDVWGEEHAHAFTVAKAMQLDVLTSLRDGVDSAIAEGKTFEQFREELEPTLRKKGWWGRKTMTDPATGKPVKARLGSPRRLKIVYESNIRSANAAGTWDRAQRAKELLPYFRYELGPSLKHRPHHVAREGMTYPVDHPIWNEWYPPNGWGCKCWLRQIMEEEAVETGWEDAPEPDIPRKTYVNKRTGEVVDIPDGVDPGWHTNPGKVRGDTLRALLSERLETVPGDLRDVALKDMLDDWAFKKLRTGELGEGATAPIGLVPAEVAQRLGLKRRAVWVDGRTAAQAALSDEDWGAVQAALGRGRILRGEGDILTVSGESGLEIGLGAAVERGSIRILALSRGGVDIVARPGAVVSVSQGRTLELQGRTREEMEWLAPATENADDLTVQAINATDPLGDMYEADYLAMQPPGYLPTGRVMRTPKKRGSAQQSIFMHEYGHHVDFNLSPRGTGRLAGLMDRIFDRNRDASEVAISARAWRALEAERSRMQQVWDRGVYRGISKAHEPYTAQEAAWLRAIGIEPQFNFLRDSTKRRQLTGKAQAWAGDQIRAFEARYGFGIDEVFANMGERERVHVAHAILQRDPIGLSKILDRRYDETGLENWTDDDVFRHAVNDTVEALTRAEHGQGHGIDYLDDGPALSEESVLRLNSGLEVFAHSFMMRAKDGRRHRIWRDLFPEMMPGFDEVIENAVQ